MSQYSAYRHWVWRVFAYVAAATVAGIAVASQPRVRPGAEAANDPGQDPAARDDLAAGAAVTTAPAGRWRRLLP